MEETHTSARSALNFAFWRRFLEKRSRDCSLFTSLSPNSGGYRDVHVGLDGVKYLITLGDHHIRVALFIGSSDVDSNDALMQRLVVQRVEIEDAFGSELDWDSSGKSARTISTRIETGGLLDVEHWDELGARVVSTLERLYDALAGPLRAAGLPLQD